MAVLDTNLLIALEAQDEDAIGWIEAHAQEPHVVPDIVAVEYLTRHPDPVGAFEALRTTFEIGTTDTPWIQATALFRGRLHRRKIRVRVPDFWIAAWAHHLETHVVTRNPKHFEGLGVPVETW